MPIKSVQANPETLTLTAIGDYEVPVERLWEAWVDPRQLEQFWGPPEWPATFTRHEVRPDGRSDYFMTGPNAERSHGYWRFEVVEAHRRFAIRDGFAKPDGTPNPEFPETRMEVTFEATPTGSRFVAVSTFASVEAMEKLVAMGMVEGLSSALSQLDALLADLRELSANMKAALEVVDDTHVVVRRVVRGPIDLVWRAHHEAALLQKWLLGPDGWTMPVCEVATEAHGPSWNRVVASIGTISSENRSTYAPAMSPAFGAGTSAIAGVSLADRFAMTITASSPLRRTNA